MLCTAALHTGQVAKVDACPGGVQEEQAADTQAFRSTKEGQMHACGHDTHMTMLLGGMQPLKALHPVRLIELHFSWRNP